MKRNILIKNNIYFLCLIFNIYIYIKNNIYIKRERDFFEFNIFYTVECFLTRDLLDGKIID